jgi:integrase
MPKGVAKRWRKKYQGHIYYFRGDYETAAKTWHAKRTELETTEAEDQPNWYRARFQRMLEWCQAQGMVEDVEAVTKALEGTDLDLSKLWWSYDDREKGIWSERLRQMERPAKEPTTIGQAVEAFLAAQYVRVAANAISAGYYDLLRRSLNHFADTIGRRVGVASITGLTLSTYHSAVLGKVSKDGWSPDYASGYIRSMKTFVTWAWETELIENKPRNLEGGRLTIETKAKKIKVFTNDEIKVLLGAATERNKLYIMLMLNTGMTQKDLSDLRPDEVDWTKGRIKRKRSKTRKFENVPVVEYPLWSATFALLKKFGSRKGERVLSNADGGTLITETLTEDGKYSKTDNARCLFGKLVRRLVKDKKLKTFKPLKVFRKTSPSRLEDKPEFAACARYFGGWSPRGVSERHYIAVPQATFDRAVMWLAKSYGLEK